MMKKVLIATLLLCASSLSVRADGTGVAGPDQFPERTGSELFRAICQSCHMPDAGGAKGAGSYPALANNSNLQSSMYLANVIMYGRNGMPGFGGVLDNEQITNLVNYIRSDFGNNYQDAITENDVKAIRKPDHQYVDMN